MKLNRRDFIMGSLALGGAAAVGGLAGCSAPKQTPSDQGAMPDTGAEKGIPLTANGSARPWATTTS